MTDSTTTAKPRPRLFPGRFLLLSSTLFVVLAIYPFWNRSALGIASFDLLFWGLILVSTHSLGRARWGLSISIALAVPAFISDIAVYVFPTKGALLGSCLLDLLFLTFVTGAVIHHVVSREQVDLDKILGALCGYLLLGLSGR